MSEKFDLVIHTTRGASVAGIPIHAQGRYAGTVMVESCAPITVTFMDERLLLEFIANTSPCRVELRHATSEPITELVARIQGVVDLQHA